MTTSENNSPPVPPEAFEDTAPHPTLDELEQTPENIPVVSEVPLGGIVPRPEPVTHTLPPSGDLYLRLEGRIYGPFQPDILEELLQSGKLTGFETASPDLHRWTPLAYHPRIVRNRYRNLDQAHQLLAEMSALPAVAKPKPMPRAAIVRRPKHRPAQSPEDVTPANEAEENEDGEQGNDA